jgi:hypothetical protein
VQLTDLSVRHLKTEAKQRTHFDDTLQGFGVRVSPGGTKTFVLVYGPARERISIGRYGVISLADEGLPVLLRMKACPSGPLLAIMDLSSVGISALSGNWDVVFTSPT